MKSDGLGDASSASHDAVERLLEMPAEHGVGDKVEPEVKEPRPIVHRTFWQRLNHFFFEKEPNQSSSIAPRDAQGRRTKPFFFNGNGRGR